MRNLKKFLAVLVVVAMMATSMMSAFAAADPAMTPAEKAEGLGLLKGGADGKVDEAYLNLTTQRIQTAIIYLRLMGKEAEARAYTATTDNFADSNLVSGDAVNLLAYLRANPQLGWVGDGTNFNPLGEVSGQALYKVMLTAVGYTQGLDFDYADTIGFARAKGFSLAAYVGYADSVTNNGMAAAMIEALGTNMNGKTTTLAAKLVADKVITEADASKYTSYVAATPTPTLAPDKIAIESVKSDNLIQLNVKFNMPVDATKGVDKANYTVKVGTATKTIAADGIKLSADKMTATILLEAASALAQSDVAVVTYAKAAAGTAADLTGTSAAIVDTTVPTVKSVAVTGTKMLTVVYSEPVQGANSIANYTIDGSVYSGVAPTLSKDGLTATVILAQRIVAGTHKVLIKTDVKDYANIPVSPNSNDITVAVDTTAPTAPTVVGDATQTKVVVKFPEAIDTIGSVKANGLEAASVTADDTDKALWTLKWNFGTALPAAANTLTFTDVMDMSANNASSLTLAINPVVDVVRPALAATNPFVQKSSTTFTVEYSKDVQTLIGSYTLKDKDGNVNTVTASAFTEDNATSPNTKKVLLTAGANLNPDSAPWTLKISGVKDNTALQNEIIETTQTVVFADKVKPTFDSAFTVTDANNVQTVYAVFSEDLDSVTATTAANYTMINVGASKVTALPSTAILELTTSKIVKITIPANSGALKVATADFDKLNASGVKDKALNSIDTTAIQLVGPTNNAATIMGTAVGTTRVTGEREIKVVLNNAISKVSQTDFVIRTVPATGTGTVLSATSASLSADGLTVTLTMAEKLRADGRYLWNDQTPVSVKLNENATAANVYGTKMTTVAGNITTGVTALDAFAPTVTAVANAYTDKETFTSIKLKVSENMATAVDDNASGEWSVVINGVARVLRAAAADAANTTGITYTAPTTADTQAYITLTMAGVYTDIFNKAYSVSFAPIAGSTFVDATGLGAVAANTNALKAFTLSGTVGNTP